MVTVAISGATSTIGSNLVDEVLSSKKHRLVVLSRSEQAKLPSRGVDVRVVDYGNVNQIATALAGVHTVISCIWTFGPEVARPRFLSSRPPKRLALSASFHQT